MTGPKAHAHRLARAGQRGRADHADKAARAGPARAAAGISAARISAMARVVESPSVPGLMVNAAHARPARNARAVLISNPRLMRLQTRGDHSANSAAGRLQVRSVMASGRFASGTTARAMRTRAMRTLVIASLFGIRSPSAKGSHFLAVQARGAARAAITPSGKISRSVKTSRSAKTGPRDRTSRSRKRDHSAMTARRAMSDPARRAAMTRRGLRVSASRIWRASRALPLARGRMRCRICAHARRWRPRLSASPR